MPFFRGLLEEDRCDTTGYSLSLSLSLSLDVCCQQQQQRQQSVVIWNMFFVLFRGAPRTDGRTDRQSKNKTTSHTKSLCLVAKSTTPIIYSVTTRVVQPTTTRYSQSAMLVSFSFSFIKCCWVSILQRFHWVHWVPEWSFW